MNQVILKGLNGANPLGFLAAMGFLRFLRPDGDAARLGFLSDGSFHPFVTGFEGDLAALVCRDAALADGKQAWSVEYEKHEKRGIKVVADLKAPPDVFARFLSGCVAHWLNGESEPAAVDGASQRTAAVSQSRRGGRGARGGLERIP